MNSYTGSFEAVNRVFHRHFEDIAQDYDELEPVPYSLHKMILHSLPERKDAYLDLGCGTGRLLEMIAPQFNFSTGLDFSKQMIEVAKRRTGKKTDFVCCSIDEMEFEGRLFDYVTCTGVLHHLHNDPSRLNRTLLKMRRILRPGGRLLVADFVIPGIIKKRSDWLYHIFSIYNFLKNRDVTQTDQDQKRDRVLRDHMVAERGMLFTKREFHRVFGEFFENSRTGYLSRKYDIVKSYYLIWDNI